jgi:hypothetical protein
MPTISDRPTSAYQEYKAILNSKKIDSPKQEQPPDEESSEFEDSYGSSQGSAHFS